MYTIEYFREDLNRIGNDNIRKFVEYTLNNVPNYFWSIPASSTGKYHPEISLGEGGLCRHTKAALLVCYESLKNKTIMESFFGCDLVFEEPTHVDAIIGALILHDTCKNGFDGSTYTVFNHPMLVRKIADKVDVSTFKHEEIRLLTMMFTAIESHMGEWNKDHRTNQEDLPLPITKISSFVHYCDYIASRKFMTLNDID